MVDLVAYCPHCGRKSEYELINERKKIKSNGVIFSYIERHARCLVCKKDIHFDVLDNLNINARDKAFLDFVFHK